MLGSKTVRDTFFLEHLAERISIDDGIEESDMDRGVRLESQAIAEFEKLTGKKVELCGICERDDNPFLAYSPDGLIKTDGKYKAGVEAKCLSSKNHVKAWLSNQIPDEYYPQAVQSFIVNEDQDTLYFVLYDPRVTVHPLHVIELHRKDIEADIEDYKNKQLEFLAEIDKKLEELIQL